MKRVSNKEKKSKTAGKKSRKILGTLLLIGILFLEGCGMQKGQDGSGAIEGKNPAAEQENINGNHAASRRPSGLRKTR